MSVETERLYDLIEQRTGIVRKTDARLEAIAADRALEARFQVGLDCVEPCEITHPVNELKARTFPIQGTFKGVWENAFWTYKVADQADPHLAALDAWWASPVHKANLMRVEATTYGLGVYSEKRINDNNRRWYFILVLTKDLLASPDAPKASLRKGAHVGFKYHDDGSVADSKTATYADTKVLPVVRRSIINGEAQLELGGGALNGYWVKEGRFVVFKS